MKTISISDLRRRWPEVESLLRLENEIIITRFGKPVAKLVRYEEVEKSRKRFDPVAHAKWRNKLFGGKKLNLVDRYLSADRQDRALIPKRTN